MSQTKNGRVFSIIAGILFLLRGCSLILRNMNYLREDPGSYSISFFTVLWWGIYIGLGIFFLIGKKHFGFLIASGLAAILNVYILVQNIPYLVKYSWFFMNNLQDVLSHALSFAAYVFIFVVFFIYIVPAFRKNIKIIKFLWFLPAILCLGGYIINMSNYSKEDWGFIILLMLSETAGMLFAGLWLKSSLPEKEFSAGGQPPYPQYQQSNMNYNIPYQSNTNGSIYPQYQPNANGNAYTGFQNQPAGKPVRNVQEEAEKLKAYKDLLDSGVITQEEFDAKKKEILEL